MACSKSAPVTPAPRFQASCGTASAPPDPSAASPPRSSCRRPGRSAPAGCRCSTSRAAATDRRDGGTGSSRPCRPHRDVGCPHQLPRAPEPAARRAPRASNCCWSTPRLKPSSRPAGDHTTAGSISRSSGAARARARGGGGREPDEITCRAEVELRVARRRGPRRTTGTRPRIGRPPRSTSGDASPATSGSCGIVVTRDQCARSWLVRKPMRQRPARSSKLNKRVPAAPDGDDGLVLHDVAGIGQHRVPDRATPRSASPMCRSRRWQDSRSHR